MPTWIIELFFLALGAATGVVTTVLSAIMTYRGFMRGANLEQSIINSVSAGMLTAFVGFTAALGCWLIARSMQQMGEN